MRQRAMIAMAMALNPALLIADEPTTALDVTVQAQVLRVIERLQAEFGTAVIIITHDLGVIAEVGGQRGRDVRRGDHGVGGPRRHLLRQPPSLHGGAAAIVASLRGEKERLHPIAGQPPSLITLPAGCKFHPRCPYVMDRCLSEEPALAPVEGSPEHLSSCWLPHSREGRMEARVQVTGEPTPI